MGEVLCPVVIGRQSELHTLGAALDSALAGHGRSVFITGEPGIGKSRLARDTAHRAQTQGVAVAIGRAVPAESGTPFRPLSEALLGLLRNRRLPEGPDLAPWRPALGAILPGLAGRARGDPSAAARGEAVIRFLRGVVGSEALVVVLEDLHWADPDTLAVVEYMADNIQDEHLLIVATSRDEAPSNALELIHRLHTRRAAAHLALPRLTSEEVDSMVLACLPTAAQPAMERVRQSADGIPFLVEEVLAAPGETPTSFAETVMSRVAEFSAEHRQVLAAAAVLGRLFDWRLLASATGSSSDVVATSLEQAVECQLLSVEAESFRFRHALTREVVVSALLPPRRAALAAALLNAVSEADPDLAGARRDLAADLATQSGDPERAGVLLTGSGQTALERGALATAVETLTRAVEMLDPRLPPIIEAETSLIEALGLAGRVDEAITVGHRLIGRMTADGAEGDRRAAIHVRLAQAAVAATRWSAATSHLDAATALLDSRSQSEDGPGSGNGLEAQVLVLQAEVALAQDDVDRARGLAEAVLAVERANAGTRCQALEVLGRSERLMDLGAAASAFEKALAVADSAELGVWRLRALHELGTIEMFQRASAGRLLEARRTAQDLGALSLAAVLDLQLSAVSIFRFDLEGAGRHARSSLEMAERLGLSQIRAKALLFLAETNALAGRREEMEQWLGRALAAAPEDGSFPGFAWGCRAEIALVSDDQPGVLDALHRALSILSGFPHAEPAFFRALAPLVLASMGDPGAQAALDAARATGVDRAPPNRGALTYAEAVLAGRAGTSDHAMALARTAAADMVDVSVWHAVARLYAAEAAGADDWGQPRRWLEQGAVELAPAGLDRLAERCRRLLTGPSTTARAEVPFGLTAREVEVLGLVSDGLSNKEIAGRLRLSPRTVEKHVESLLRKTESRSRTQLVALTRSGPTT